MHLLANYNIIVPTQLSLRGSQIEFQKISPEHSLLGKGQTLSGFVMILMISETRGETRGESQEVTDIITSKREIV